MIECDECIRNFFMCIDILLFKSCIGCFCQFFELLWRYLLDGFIRDALISNMCHHDDSIIISMEFALSRETGKCLMTKLKFKYIHMGIDDTKENVGCDFLIIYISSSLSNTFLSIIVYFDIIKKSEVTRIFLLLLRIVLSRDHADNRKDELDKKP